MSDDIVKLRGIVEYDVKFLEGQGIMDYSLLLSAERYTAQSIKQDTGDLLDPATPKNDNPNPDIEEEW